MLVGLGALIGGSIANEWGTLSVAFQDGLSDIRRWMADGPLHASDTQIDDWIASLQKALSNNQGSLVSGALSTAATAAEVISGAFLALFSTIFFLHDGKGIAGWFVALFPKKSQEGVSEESNRQQGAYYVMADITAFGTTDDVAFARHLVRDLGVATVPGSSFFHDKALGRKPTSASASASGDETLDAAVQRLGVLKAVV